MQNLPKDAPVAETVSFWFAGDHNLTMSPTGRAIVRFSMPGLPVGSYRTSAASAHSPITLMIIRFGRRPSNSV
jgi:hypothetical protein